METFAKFKNFLLVICEKVFTFYVLHSALWKVKEENVGPQTFHESYCNIQFSLSFFIPFKRTVARDFVEVLLSSNSPSWSYKRLPIEPFLVITIFHKVIKVLIQNAEEFPRKQKKSC